MSPTSRRLATAWRTGPSATSTGLITRPAPRADAHRQDSAKIWRSCPRAAPSANIQPSLTPTQATGRPLPRARSRTWLAAMPRLGGALEIEAAELERVPARRAGNPHDFGQRRRVERPGVEREPIVHGGDRMSLRGLEGLSRASGRPPFSSSGRPTSGRGDNTARCSRSRPRGRQDAAMALWARAILRPGLPQVKDRIGGGPRGPGRLRCPFSAAAAGHAPGRFVAFTHPSAIIRA